MFSPSVSPKLFGLKGSRAGLLLGLEASQVHIRISVLINKDTNVEDGGRSEKRVSGSGKKGPDKKEDSFMSLFVAYLRWSEGFIMNAARLRHRIGKGRDGPLDHVVIPLMGRFKGETGRCNHPQTFLNDITLKLKVR